ncbi:MAG: M20/M25/M40 family metallo-hydrolase [Cyclobacteriaceae bacterium]|nr:M20/M25/M40 family metallo-hydrolase [Cyclobacteriaceae bacterium]
MNKVVKKSVAFLLALICYGSIFGQSSFEINQKYVENKLKVLSSDDLKGRKVFSEGIEKAADIIADDFKKTGLSYLPGLSSYRQEFFIYNLSTAEIDVSINGKKIDESQVFGLFNQSEISWTTETTIEIVKITKEQNFQESFSNVQSKETSTLVFVDKSHETIFSRYQHYFSKGGMKFEKNKGSSTVYILIDDLSPTNFLIHFINKYEEKALANVGGMIEGNRKDEIVLFSGHYDHIGIQKEVEGDSIANGANDDASGTTAVMALAKYFKGKEKPERTIYFVAFTAEEVGGYGSQYFSKQLNPDHIVAMFNIEMIGKPAVEGPNTAWITGFEKSSFGKLLQKSVEGTAYTFYPDPYPSQNLFYRSDNATLARLGVPAHSISTTPIDVDKDYHQVSDEIETINISHMTNTIKAISVAAEGIISGRDTPTRVDKSNVN